VAHGKVDKMEFFHLLASQEEGIDDTTTPLKIIFLGFRSLQFQKTVLTQINLPRVLAGEIFEGASNEIPHARYTC
jgi:hypothetical protein